MCVYVCVCGCAGVVFTNGYVCDAWLCVYVCVCMLE